APLPGAAVRFAVGGGGSLVGATPVTTADGVAQVTAWTLSATPGANAVTASVSGVAPVTFNATAELPSYTIALQNTGPPLAPGFQSAVDAARVKWERIVYRDVPDIPNVTIPANGGCGNTSTIGPITIDDVLILLRFDAIDGPGNILGFAGPCAVRTTGSL